MVGGCRGAPDGQGRTWGAGRGRRGRGARSTASSLLEGRNTVQRESSPAPPRRRGEQAPFVIVTETGARGTGVAASFSGGAGAGGSLPGAAAAAWHRSCKRGDPSGVGQALGGCAGGRCRGTMGGVSGTGGCWGLGRWLCALGGLPCSVSPSLRDAPNPVPLNPFLRSNDKSGS